jgi:flagellar basal body L-ring protein FlgH
MKKVFAIFAIAALTACGDAATEATVTPEATTVTPEATTATPEATTATPEATTATPAAKP